MPKYQCEDCGAIFYGWGSKGICQKCGGRLISVSESSEVSKNPEKASK